MPRPIGLDLGNDHVHLIHELIEALDLLRLNRLELTHEGRKGQIDLTLIVVVVAQQGLDTALRQHAEPSVTAVAEVHLWHAWRAPSCRGRRLALSDAVPLGEAACRVARMLEATLRR